MSKYLLGQQSAGPASQKPQDMQGALPGPPPAVSGGKFIKTVNTKSDAAAPYIKE